MNTRQRLCCLFLSMTVIAATLFAGALTEREQNKLSPAFQAAVSRFLPEAASVAAGPVREPVLRRSDGTPLFGAVIYTASPEAVRAEGVHVNSILPGFVTAVLSPAEMVALARRDDVFYLDAGAENVPLIDVSIPELGAQMVHAGFINNTPYKGKGAIVLVYDTGIDWKHQDFRNPSDTTKSRILRIWDQTLMPVAGETNPSGFSYGVEYTKAQIDDELDGTPTGIVRERDINGHGTHVMGTAAGNGLSYAKRYIGVAPEADIVVVKGGDYTFSDANMIDALTYATGLAGSFGKPIVVNWSIGSQSGPHDGSRGYEQAINAFTSVPGRIHVNSAGNDGDQAIHVEGDIVAGDSVLFTFTVPTYTPTSGTKNDYFVFEFWLRGNQGCRATVVSPTGLTYTRLASEFGTSTADGDGSMYLNNYLSSGNGHRSVYLEVSDVDAAKPPKNGTWTLRIAGLTSAAVFDGWLVRRTVGGSSVTLAGGNTSHTVSSPANAAGTITAASYVSKWGWPTYWGSSYVYTGTDRTQNISTFSSKGPTADDRQKPDIAAPGQGITASLSAWSAAFTNSDSTRIVPGKRHWLIQGTSMAAPHVTGTAALLLGMEPTLTAAAIKTLLTTTTNTDANTGSVPNLTWGHGKMDVLRAAARQINPTSTVSRNVLAYDPVTTSSVFTLNNPFKYAVRFTPSVSGKVTGIQLNVTTPSNRPVVGTGPLQCEVFSNTGGSIGGVPGSRIGNVVTMPFSQLSPSTNNPIDMLPANASVVGGMDYHIVISLPAATDTLKFRVDDGTTAPTNRSSIYNGTAWLNLADPAWGVSPVRNLRLRVVVTSSTGVNDVEELTALPVAYALDQNYPNPFNPSTNISYQISAIADVRLGVFDLLGREVRTLVNERKQPGQYVVAFDAAGLASGVYFYRLEANGFVQSRKMTLVK